MKGKERQMFCGKQRKQATGNEDNMVWSFLILKDLVPGCCNELGLKTHENSIILKVEKVIL